VSISAEGQLTLADLWKGSLLHSRKTVALFTVLGLAMLGVAIVAMLHGWNRPGAARDERALLGIGVFWIAYGPLAILYRCNANLRRNPGLQGSLRYRFNEDGYVRESQQGSGNLKWNALVGWRESDSSLLFYPSPKSFIIVPKRFFQSPADVNSLHGILQSAVTRK
jgi:hypothetical protein